MLSWCWGWGDRRITSLPASQPPTPCLRKTRGGLHLRQCPLRPRFHRLCVCGGVGVYGYVCGCVQKRCVNPQHASECPWGILTSMSQMLPKEKASPPPRKCITASPEVRLRLPGSVPDFNHGKCCPFVFALEFAELSGTSVVCSNAFYPLGGFGNSSWKAVFRR